MSAILAQSFPALTILSGKVREVFDVWEALILVATHCLLA
jgi:hypothetical protein